MSTWRGTPREAESTESESFDVLLQLTLPIVLILAFFVATEIKTLQKNLEEMKAALEGTETGELLLQRDLAVIELQKQLLVKATEEVMRAREDEIGLAEYGSVLPGADDILDNRVPPRFRQISFALYRAFNDPARAADDVRRRILDSYAVLALPSASLRDRPLTKDLERFLVTQMGGHLERVTDKVVLVQLRVVEGWIGNPRVAELIWPESKEIWDDLQKQPAGPGRDALRRRFDFVSVSKLQQRLEAAGAPLLDKTVNGVK